MLWVAVRARQGVGHSYSQRIIVHLRVKRPESPQPPMGCAKRSSNDLFCTQCVAGSRIWGLEIAGGGMFAILHAHYR